MERKTETSLKGACRAMWGPYRTTYGGMEKRMETTTYRFWGLGLESRASEI